MKKKFLSFLFVLVFIIAVSYSATITVTNPHGGENWVIGNTYTITWNSNGITGPVGIKLFQNGRSLGYIAQNVPNTGSYSWTINNIIGVGPISAGSHYQIQVKKSGVAAGLSAGEFTISNPPAASITVTNPHSGDVWYTERTYTIKWKKIGEMNTKVKIFLMQGNKMMLNITNSTPNNKIYTWIVPASIRDGYYYIKVMTKDNAVYGDSDEFKIEEHLSDSKPFIEKIFPTKGKIGTEIEIFGKNFYSQNDHRIYIREENSKIGPGLKVLVWKNNYIKASTENAGLKAGKYKIRIVKTKGEGAFNVSTNSNEVDFEIVEPEKKNCMLKIVRAGLFKNRIKEGEEVKYFIVVRNESNKDFKGDIFGRISLTSTSNKYRNGLEIKQNIILEEGQEKQINLSFRSDSMKDFTAGVYFAEFFIVYKVDSSLECKNKYESKSQLIVEEKKEDFDLSAYNCGYKKDVFTKGETGDFVVTVTNKGPSTVKKYKIIAWSVRGNGKSLVSIRGKTGQSFQRDRELKANESIMEGLKLKIKDSPGDYTLFIKVESIDPTSNKEKNKTNNTCRISYKVLYKANTTSISRPITLNFPDLTFDSRRTKIGTNGIEAVIKNLNYQKAKLPVPKDKEIYVKIENISSIKFQRNILEFSLPKWVIMELNKTGETNFISRLGIRFPRARITIDSKNSILESNENNNTIVVE